MHPDRDFDAPPSSPKELVDFAQDLELNVLLNAAAAEDRYLYDIMAAVCDEAWTNDIVTIQYRQSILKDCLANSVDRPAILCDRHRTVWAEAELEFQSLWT